MTGRRDEPIYVWPYDSRWPVLFRQEAAALAELIGPWIICGIHHVGMIVSSSDNLWTKDAVVRDPQGAEFTVSQFTPPDGDW